MNPNKSPDLIDLIYYKKSLLLAEIAISPTYLKVMNTHIISNERKHFVATQKVIYHKNGHLYFAVEYNAIFFTLGDDGAKKWPTFILSR